MHRLQPQQRTEVGEILARQQAAELDVGHRTSCAKFDSSQ